MPIFSLCIPTRNRPQHVERLIRSLLETVDDITRVEILFGIDNDDIISNQYLQYCKERYPQISIRIYERLRGDFLNQDYFNMLASFSTGEYCWVMGDDVIFISAHWDTYLLEQINRFFIHKKDKIVYVNIPDDTPLPDGVTYRYANFPLISKEAIASVGFFMPPSIPSWSSDYLIHLPYRFADRLLKIDRLILKHISSHTNVVEPDESEKRQREFYGKYKIKEQAAYWEEYVAPVLTERIKQAIRKA